MRGLGCRIFAIVLVLGLTSVPGPGLADSRPWRVVKLPGSGGWFDGPTMGRSAEILKRGDAYGYYSLYLLELIPGVDYTLGLRYSSAVTDKPSVILFDRWPQEAAAKSYRLPVGPVVRTNYVKTEFRWRLGVSSRSKGRIAFLAVGAQTGISGPAIPFRHSLYLTTPAISPIHQPGEGITYLRGPLDLSLAPANEPVEYLVEYPYERPYSRAGRDDQRRMEPNLIRNGDFSQGLVDWQLLPATAEGVGVFNGKLRIWSHETSATAGVIQQIDAVAKNRKAAQLSMEIMIAAQTAPSRSGGPCPLTLSLCYEDTAGMTHCGETAFRRDFGLQRGAAQNQPRDIVFLPSNEWFQYIFDFMTLKPNLRRLISVELSGNGAPERDAWVKEIRISR